MKAKVFIAFCLIFVAVIAVVQTVSSSRQALLSQQITELEEKEKLGRINFGERVQLAKARGKERIVVPSISTLYLEIPTSLNAFDEKLLNYTVVVAQLAETKSYMPDQGVIRTWNKLRVLETLSQAPPRPTYFTRPAPPDEVLPVKEDEILVHTEGGTVIVDGIEVAQSDTDVPALHKSDKYLLVLSFDLSTRIGELELGPLSVLPINKDNSLKTYWDAHYLQQVVKEHYSGSINQMKSGLKSRSGSQ